MVEASRKKTQQHLGSGHRDPSEVLIDSYSPPSEALRLSVVKSHPTVTFNYPSLPFPHLMTVFIPRRL